MDCSCSKRETLERPEIGHNNIYSLPVRLDLWFDQTSRLEDKRSILKYKKDRCQLLVQKTKKAIENLFKPTDLIMRDDAVYYDVFYQFRATDIQRVGPLCLTAAISLAEIDVQHFMEGTGAYASRILRPCVMNTFKIVGGKEGQQIKYGDAVSIQICDNPGPPLYLACHPRNTTSLGSPLQPQLSHRRDTNSKFKFLHWAPQMRAETTGTTLVPNCRILIQHQASGRNLVVEPDVEVPKITGLVREVSCSMRRDSHKMDREESFWRITTKGSVE